MRIGIDIDGVLTDIERFMIDHGTKFCFENKIEESITLGEYDDAKMFNCNEEYVIEFWRRNLIDYFENYPIRDFAKEIIEKLKEEGNEIYIITARDDYGVPPEYIGKVREITKDWLDKNKIPYDKLIFTQESKLPYCIENYVEVMVEDSPDNIKEISSKLPVICFNNYWNEKIKENKNIIRAYSWYQVYRKLKDMK